MLHVTYVCRTAPVVYYYVMAISFIHGWKAEDDSLTLAPTDQDSAVVGIYPQPRIFLNLLLTPPCILPLTASPYTYKSIINSILNQIKYVTDPYKLRIYRKNRKTCQIWRVTLVCSMFPGRLDLICIFSNTMSENA